MVKGKCYRCGKIKELVYNEHDADYCFSCTRDYIDFKNVPTGILKKIKERGESEEEYLNGFGEMI